MTSLMLGQHFAKVGHWFQGPLVSKKYSGLRGHSYREKWVLGQPILCYEIPPCSYYLSLPSLDLITILASLFTKSQGHLYFREISPCNLFWCRLFNDLKIRSCHSVRQTIHFQRLILSNQVIRLSRSEIRLWINKQFLKYKKKKKSLLWTLSCFKLWNFPCIGQHGLGWWGLRDFY